jgi:hypothetical protein
MERKSRNDDSPLCCLGDSIATHVAMLQLRRNPTHFLLDEQAVAWHDACSSEPSVQGAHVLLRGEFKVINPPAFSLGHPDRALDCEMSVEGEFRALADRVEAAGWTGDEAASTLLLLALKHLEFREKTRGDAARISEARRKTGQ